MSKTIDPRYLKMSDGMLEVAGILAAGILRARRNKAKVVDNGSFSGTGLDCSRQTSVHSSNTGARGENR